MSIKTVTKRLAPAITISLLLLSALIIKSNPSIITPKEPGVFEFVRKGEALFHKGDYAKAVREFEKAYEISPENDTVRYDLISAYTQYAQTFTRSGDHDKALGILAKSYEVSPVDFTRQNIAMTLIGKAVALAVKKDWYGAMATLSNVRDTAEEADNSRLQKNIAVILFNTAVERYKAQDERMAIICLKESLLVSGQSAANEFLGDIYERRGEFDQALFFISKAALALPDEPRIKEKEEKLKKEIDDIDSSRHAESPHFEYRYEKGLAVDTAAVTRSLENAYFKVGRDFKFFPDRKTVIYLYSEKNFRDIFKLPNIVLAFYDGNIRMPYPDRAVSVDELERYVFHEYTHAAVSARSKTSCPVWLNEGIAVWAESKHHTRPDIVQLRMAMDGFDLKLQALEAAFGSGETTPDMGRYYIISYSFVDFLTKKWGDGIIRNILDRLAGGEHVMNALDDETLLSEAELDKAWREYYAK